MDRVWRPKPTAMIWVSVSYAVWSISARACAVSSRSTRIFVPTLPHSSSIHSNSSRTLSWRSSADSFACVSPFSFLSTPPARYSIYHSSRLFIHVHFCCKVGQEFLKTWDRIKESMAFAKEKLDIAYIWAKNMVRFIGPSVVLLWPVYYIIRYRWTKFLRYPLSYQFNSLLIGKKTGGEVYRLTTISYRIRTHGAKWCWQKRLICQLSWSFSHWWNTRGRNTTWSRRGCPIKKISAHSSGRHFSWWTWSSFSPFFLLTLCTPLSSTRLTALLSHSSKLTM